MSGLLDFKSCCYCLSLKSGSIICAIIYLLLGSFLFVEEIHLSIYKFMHHLENAEPNELEVVFLYDLQPSFMIVFSMYLLYGIFKENQHFIFSGVILAVTLTFTYCFVVLFYFIIFLARGFQRIPNNTEQVIEDSIMLCVNYYILLVLYNHYKEICSRKRGRIFERMSTRSRGSSINVESAIVL